VVSGDPVLDVLQRLVPELRVVEYLALAQQTDVQLVPRVPLDALGDELHRVVARQAGDPLADGDHGDGRRQPEQYGARPTRGGDQVECPADVYLDGTVEAVVEHGRDQRNQRNTG